MLLEGRPGRLLPRHNIQALESGLFNALGCLVGHSILHGGPGLPMLSKSVFDYLCLESNSSSSAGVQLQLSIDDVIDDRVSDVIDKVWVFSVFCVLIQSFSESFSADNHISPAHTLAAYVRTVFLVSLLHNLHDSLTSLFWVYIDKQFLNHMVHC